MCYLSLGLHIFLDDLDMLDMLDFLLADLGWGVVSCFPLFRPRLIRR